MDGNIVGGGYASILFAHNGPSGNRPSDGTLDFLAFVTYPGTTVSADKLVYFTDDNPSTYPADFFDNTTGKSFTFDTSPGNLCS